MFTYLFLTKPMLITFSSFCYIITYFRHMHWRTKVALYLPRDLKFIFQ